MRNLIVYPNCSKGGVTSVIRGRARRSPGDTFDAVFLHDRGGRAAFTDLPNVNVRVVRPDRVSAYLDYVLSAIAYDHISVLSHPEIANQLSANDEVAVRYEFHSSDVSVIEREISALALDRLAGIAAPSSMMAERIVSLLPARMGSRVQVDRNLVDAAVFVPEGDAAALARSRFAADAAATPLVWVGRFDKGKGYQYLLRALALLPERYTGIVVVSLEDDPRRASDFFSEAAALGVSNRVRLLLNLSQAHVAELYRSARDAGGSLIATSLLESYGYSVNEAIGTGLPVVAFDLPVWDEIEDARLLQRVPGGDVQALVRAVTGGGAG